MSLRARLASLQAQSGSNREIRAESSAAEDLRRRLARLESERRPLPRPEAGSGIDDKELARRLTGYEIAEGVIQIERRLPLDESLGRHSLALLGNNLQLPGEGREAHLRQVYVDTETTGLSGGSGTLAFLIGLAVVERDALVVTQYLLTRYAGEGAMLLAFAKALSAEDRLVSYNGKSFDLPLLLTRYRMQGLAQSLDRLPHLDLLHSIRRLFGKRWPDCRLATLEQRLLGFRRKNDLPGAEAPAAWSGYLRSGAAEKLIRVVEHNRQDIVSLALAQALLPQVIRQPEPYGADLVSLAHWLNRFDRERAFVLLRSARQPLCDRGKRLLGQLARRAEEWELATRIWRELAQRGCQESTEELAKYHEHISRDLSVARRYCEQLTPGAGRTRRLARLETKLQNQERQSSLGALLSHYR